ncbi:uncharacterized protein NPIL_165381 [Nephila pilipes]|uniref:Uncharacterized protein n=1 Tax=Nephila pilipes TaxID=299642 RepID=A0A8X6PRX4_NEPPI|nr:uncharacterized protein NPIL_165381 [Nephila pilipes]
MSCRRAVALCLLVIAVVDICSGLMLERLPRHIPRSKVRLSQDSSEDDDIVESFDTSVEKKRIVNDPSMFLVKKNFQSMNITEKCYVSIMINRPDICNALKRMRDAARQRQKRSQLAPFIMKPTWKAIYPFSQNKRTLRIHKKRDVTETDDNSEMNERERHELANILKDDEEETEVKETKTEKKEVPKHTKTKRQSNEDPESQELKDVEEQEAAPPTEDFQEWLRREYYRNMAKSFASMRRKRDGSSSYPKSKTVKRAKKSVQASNSNSLSEITDNLRNIEDQLFQDALQVMREGGEDYEDDVHRQNRIFNDLSLAYDLETMRNAFFRLKETLGNMENEDEEEMYHTSRKRSRQCPALDTLTSDCSTLSDVMPEGPLKKLLLRACNWHEVCYTCGKTYGLTSESCDGSFIEQTQTICHNDAPCESTASLLIVPLRQRRVFYKRSNPDVCVDEPCVEAFLKEGLAAMEEGRYALRDNINAIRHA